MRQWPFLSKDRIHIRNRHASNFVDRLRPIRRVPLPHIRRIPFGIGTNHFKIRGAGEFHMCSACRQDNHIACGKLQPFSRIAAHQDGRASGPHTQDFVRVAVIMMVIVYAACPAPAPVMPVEGASKPLGSSANTPLYTMTGRSGLLGTSPSSLRKMI